MCLEDKHKDNDKAPTDRRRLRQAAWYKKVVKECLKKTKIKNTVPMLLTVHGPDYFKPKNITDMAWQELQECYMDVCRFYARHGAAYDKSFKELPGLLKIACLLYLIPSVAVPWAMMNHKNPSFCFFL